MRTLGREADVETHLYFRVTAFSGRSRAQGIAAHERRAGLARGLVTRERPRELFEGITPRLYRYPAVDPASFRRAVEDFVSA